MAVPGPAVAGLPTKPFGVSGVSVPVPDDVGGGDIIIVALHKELNAAVGTLPTDFAEAGTAPATTGHVTQLHAFAKRATAADTGTYDFAWTGTAPYAEAVALRIPAALASGSAIGTGTEAPQGAQRSSAGTATPNVALTTTGADRLLVWIGANYNGGNWTPPAAPSAFTEIYDGGACLSVATLAFPTAGATGNVAGACSASEYSTARLLTVLPPVASANRGIPIGVLL